MVKGYSSTQATTVGITFLDLTPFFDSKRAILGPFWVTLCTYLENCQKWAKFDAKSSKFYFPLVRLAICWSKGYYSIQATTVGIKIVILTPFFDSKRAIVGPFWLTLCTCMENCQKWAKFDVKPSKFYFPQAQLAICWSKGYFSTQARNVGIFFWIVLHFLTVLRQILPIFGNSPYMCIM